MEAIISRYSPNDYEDVWALHQKTISENDGYVKTLSFHTDIHDIENVYDAFFVLRADKNLVGMVGIKHTDDNCAEIKRLQVNSLYHGNGFGKKLMVTVFNYATTNNIRILRLDVSEPQKNARELYLSLGFHITHVTPRTLGADGEYFVSTYMEKQAPF